MTRNLDAVAALLDAGARIVEGDVRHMWTYGIIEALFDRWRERGPTRLSPAILELPLIRRMVTDRFVHGLHRCRVAAARLLGVDEKTGQPPFFDAADEYKPAGGEVVRLHPTIAGGLVADIQSRHLDADDGVRLQAVTSACDAAYAVPSPPLPDWRSLAFLPVPSEH